ncbi:unnamed protein product [Caenorhabditis auriculariae]|uniref:Uncharacterized protein n=1 Tax=Caenorhabditis auriculariae TaxID=2777116 RepID=A0A8S1H1Y7_9PELO|nr:unnamed protein product [Caenorhabditis auriculariae]
MSVGITIVMKLNVESLKDVYMKNKKGGVVLGLGQAGEVDFFRVFTPGCVYYYRASDYPDPASLTKKIKLECLPTEDDQENNDNPNDGPKEVPKDDPKEVPKEEPKKRKAKVLREPTRFSRRIAKISKTMGVQKRRAKARSTKKRAVKNAEGPEKTTNAPGSSTTEPPAEVPPVVNPPAEVPAPETDHYSLQEWQGLADYIKKIRLPPPELLRSVTSDFNNREMLEALQAYMGPWDENSTPSEWSVNLPGEVAEKKEKLRKYLRKFTDLIDQLRLTARGRLATYHNLIAVIENSAASFYTDVEALLNEEDQPEKLEIMLKRNLCVLAILGKFNDTILQQKISFLNRHV